MMTLPHSALPFNHIDIRMKCLSAIRGRFKRAFKKTFVWYFPLELLKNAHFAIFHLHLFPASGGLRPLNPLTKGQPPLRTPSKFKFFVLYFSLELLKYAHFAIFIFTCFRLLGGFAPQTPLPRGNLKKAGYAPAELVFNMIYLLFVTLCLFFSATSCWTVRSCRWVVPGVARWASTARAYSAT